jgi:hypothetical protein
MLVTTNDQPRTDQPRSTVDLADLRRQYVAALERGDQSAAESIRLRLLLAGIDDLAARPDRSSPQPLNLRA